LFDDDDNRYRSLPLPEQLWLSHLHRKVDEDGTVAILKTPSEAPHLAVRRALGVDTEYRRMLREPIKRLVRDGFLYVDGDLLKLANWRERQKWRPRQGKLPVPFVEAFDPETGEVQQAADTPPEVEKPDAIRTQSGRDSDAIRTRFGADSDEESGPSTGNHSPRPRENAHTPSSSASRSSSPPARGNHTVRGGEGSSTGQGSTGSDGGKVLDIGTGKKLDPADFKDPTPEETDDDFTDLTPEERERRASELPSEKPNHDVATEGAGLFDEDDGAL
jgi:hypothetical protein